MFQGTSIHPTSNLLRQRPRLVRRVPRTRSMLIIVVQNVRRTLLIRLPTSANRRALRPSPTQLVHLLRTQGIRTREFHPIIMVRLHIVHRPTRSHNVLTDEIRDALHRLLMVLIRPIRRLNMRHRAIVIERVPIRTMTTRRPRPLPTSNNVDRRNVQINARFFRRLLHLSFKRVIGIRRQRAHPTAGINSSLTPIRARHCNGTKANHLLPINNHLLPLQTMMAMFFNIINRRLILPGRASRFVGARHRKRHINVALGGA